MVKLNHPLNFILITAVKCIMSFTKAELNEIKLHTNRLFENPIVYLDGLIKSHLGFFTIKNPKFIYSLLELTNNTYLLQLHTYSIYNYADSNHNYCLLFQSSNKDFISGGKINLEGIYTIKLERHKLYYLIFLLNPKFITDILTKLTVSPLLRSKQFFYCFEDNKEFKRASLELANNVQLKEAGWIVEGIYPRWFNTSIKLVKGGERKGFTINNGIFRFNEKKRIFNKTEIIALIIDYQTVDVRSELINSIVKEYCLHGSYSFL